MKKIIKIFLVLFMLIPMVVNADYYEVEDSDIIVDMGERWFVFTRGNIKNNKDLDTLGVSYEYMFNYFLQNENVVVDAITLTSSDYIELLVYKERINDITNLSLYSEEELKEYAKEVSDTRECDSAGVLSLESNYNKEITSYIKCSRYVDNKYVYEFLTIVNNDIYLFQFQKDNKFSDSDIEISNTAIRNVHFNVKKRVEKEDQVIKDFKSKDDSILIRALIGALTGAAVGGACAFILYIVKKFKNDDDNNDEDNGNNNS